MNPGDIVLQPLSWDLKSAAIGLHSATMFQVPRYSHCGILVSVDADGTPKRMLTASGGPVAPQDAGATGNVFVAYAWRDWQAALEWLNAQIGKPYDWVAWAEAAVRPVLSILGIQRQLCSGAAYTCSSLVGMALAGDLATPDDALRSRTITPDEIAYYLVRRELLERLRAA